MHQQEPTEVTVVKKTKAKDNYRSWELEKEISADARKEAKKTVEALRH